MLDTRYWILVTGYWILDNRASTIEYQASSDEHRASRLKGVIVMNIFFDIRTLSVVMGVTIFTLCLSMVYYSVSRKTYTGFGAWTIGAILVSLAFLLIGLRHILPSFITIVVANALLYSALALFYLGFKSFAEKKWKPYLHVAMLLLLSLILVPFFTYVAPSVNARISLISLAAALYFFLSTLVIVKEIKYDSLIKLNKLLTATLILMSSLFAFRGVFFLLPANTIDSSSRNNHFCHIFCDRLDAVEFPNVGERVVS
jgi:hypothetical protein